MLAALLGALSLFTVAPARAQDTVWSTTMTPANVASDQVGCSNIITQAACSSTSILADDTFTHDGANYQVIAVLVIGSDLYFTFDSAPPQSFISSATLNVGSTSVPLANAVLSNNDKTMRWTGQTGLLTVGQQISLRLEVDTKPTVSLTAFPNPVDEGSKVTVTATLSEALSESVEIPLLPAWNTGTVETGDIKGPPGTITVFHGKTTGEEPVLTVRDCDTDDEMFTVAIDPARLPSSLRAADTESSVTITIEDNGAHCTQTPRTPDTTTETPTNTGGTGTGGGGGGGGGGLSPPGSDDEPPPEDEEPSTSCPQEDREILGSFYEMTDGEGWDKNENWGSTEPLDQWFGVGTDEDGEVISLRLSDNNLSGDMPTEELLCLNENTELKELALWDNDDLSGEVPEDLALAVERAALRYIADMFNINPEWFEDYEDPFNFEDWHEGVTTDDEGRVVELELPGEIPESIRSQFKKRREITITTSDGGCAVGASQGHMGASGLLAAVFIMLLALSRGLRARSS